MEFSSVIIRLVVSDVWWHSTHGNISFPCQGNRDYFYRIAFKSFFMKLRDKYILTLKVPYGNVALMFKRFLYVTLQLVYIHNHLHTTDHACLL